MAYKAPVDLDTDGHLGLTPVKDNATVPTASPSKSPHGMQIPDGSGEANNVVISGVSIDTNDNLSVNDIDNDSRLDSGDETDVDQGIEKIPTSRVAIEMDYQSEHSTTHSNYLSDQSPHPAPDLTDYTRGTASGNISNQSNYTPLSSNSNVLPTNSSHNPLIFSIKLCDDLITDVSQIISTTNINHNTNANNNTQSPIVGTNNQGTTPNIDNNNNNNNKNNNNNDDDGILNSILVSIPSQSIQQQNNLSNLNSILTRLTTLKKTLQSCVVKPTTQATVLHSLLNQSSINTTPAMNPNMSANVSVASHIDNSQPSFQRVITQSEIESDIANNNNPKHGKTNSIGSGINNAITSSLNGSSVSVPHGGNIDVWKGPPTTTASTVAVSTRSLPTLRTLRTDRHYRTGSNLSAIHDEHGNLNFGAINQDPNDPNNPDGLVGASQVNLTRASVSAMSIRRAKSRIVSQSSREPSEKAKAQKALKLEIDTQAVIYADVEDCILFKIMPDEWAYYLYENILFNKWYLLSVVFFHTFYIYYVFIGPESLGAYLNKPNDPSIVWPFVLTAWTAGSWAYTQCFTLNWKIMFGVIKSFDFWIKAFYATQLMICGMWVWGAEYSFFVTFSCYIIYVGAIGILLIFMDAWNVQNKALKVMILLFVIAAFGIATANSYFFFDDITQNPFPSFGERTQISMKSTLMSASVNLCVFFCKPIAREIYLVYGKYKGKKVHNIMKKYGNITQSNAFSTLWWIKFESKSKTLITNNNNNNNNNNSNNNSNIDIDSSHSNINVWDGIELHGINENSAHEPMSVPIEPSSEYGGISGNHSRNGSDVITNATKEPLNPKKTVTFRE